MKRLIVTSVIFITILVLSINWLLSHDLNTPYYIFGVELAKLTAQMVLIAIFGGILIQEYNRKRQNKSARNQFRKTILNELTSCYIKTKKIRRQIRAKCRGKDQARTISCSDYHKEMEQLNDIQLRLEAILIEIKSFDNAFSKAEPLTKGFEEFFKPDIISSLKKMKKYLHSLIEEYEEAQIDEIESNQVTLFDLKKLDNFNKFSAQQADAVLKEPELNAFS